jgi:hypothetical protein
MSISNAEVREVGWAKPNGFGELSRVNARLLRQTLA